MCIECVGVLAMVIGSFIYAVFVFLQNRKKHLIRRTIITTAVSGVIACGVYVSAYMPCICWDGIAHVTVRVSVRSAPRSIRYTFVTERDNADGILSVAMLETNGRCLKNLASGAKGEFANATIEVPFSGYSSICGRELNYSQDHFLVIVADLENGRRVGKVVPLPDLRYSRNVSVVLP